MGTLVSVAEQPDQALSQETSSGKNKRHAKQVVSAECKDDLIICMCETTCLYQKGSMTTWTLRRGVGCGQKGQLKVT